MAISDNLFHAILAMDAYNRGYNAGVAGLSTTGSLGTAILAQNAEGPEGIARSASFYAQAYTWIGKTIIAYRGSDGLWPMVLGMFGLDRSARLSIPTAGLGRRPEAARKRRLNGIWRLERAQSGPTNASQGHLSPFLKRALKAVPQAFVCSAALIALTCNCLCAQMSNQETLPNAAAFFSENQPDLAKLSVYFDKGELSVLKVKLLGPVTYLIGRDNSGASPALPEDLFSASVQVVEIIYGKESIGSHFEVYFGATGMGRSYKYPHTPAMRSQAYYVVTSSINNRRRLIELPISRHEYEAWRAQVREYEQKRD